MDFKGPRKIIVPAPTPKSVEVTRFDAKPSLGTLLEDSLSIMQTEILRLKRRANENIAGLTPTEANVLQGYIKALVAAAKEVREFQSKQEEATSEMDDAALLEALTAEVEAVKKRLNK